MHGVSNLNHADRTFARVFSKWILQPKGTKTRKAMEIGNSNEPVMMAELSSFFYDISAADVNKTAIVYISLVKKSQSTWLGTSPDAN